MKIIVLGAGTIGVTTAWYLAASGHEVTVIDRQPDVGLETSFANAGQVSPGYSAPWAAPGVPLKAVKWLTQDLSPLRINPVANGNLYRWMLKLLLNCNASSYQINKGRMLRLAQYSRDSLQSLREDLSLDYEQRTLGTLQVFRTAQQINGAKKDIEVLRQYGIEHQELDVKGCLDYEPGLAHAAGKLVGGLHLPGDETGDCYRYTQLMAEQCRKLGVKFLFNHHIERLNHRNNEILSVTTDQGDFTADSFVVAMASYSSLLLKPLSISLPIYPVKGFSLTVPIAQHNLAPLSTVMDETYKVAVSRFDDRIRVGGTAELAGYDLQLPSSRHANVNFVLNDLFQGAGDMSKAEYWTGLRPMTPDGTPIIGATPYDNLFINTGHGTLGWTMAAGSGRYLADVMNGKSPDISSQGLSLDRY